MTYELNGLALALLPLMAVVAILAAPVPKGETTS